MRIFNRLVLIAALLVSGAAFAQQVPATLNLSWTAPTVSDQNVPLTGASAITEYHVYVSDQAIPVNFSGAPTAIIAAPGLTMVQDFAVANGSTLHVRMSACNKPAAVLVCSDLTNEATKPVNFSTKPLPPTNIVIDIRINF